MGIPPCMGIPPYWGTPPAVTAMPWYILSRWYLCYLVALPYVRMSRCCVIAATTYDTARKCPPSAPKTHTSWTPHTTHLRTQTDTRTQTIHRPPVPCVRSYCCSLFVHSNCSFDAFSFNIPALIGSIPVLTSFFEQVVPCMYSSDILYIFAIFRACA